MGAGEITDEQLVARMVRGDVAAFEVLYDRYAPTVMGLALRVVTDRALAEEVVQETFWRVWRNAASYRSRPRFRNQPPRSMMAPKSAWSAMIV